MTPTADDIRDAEIAELQGRVKALEQRVQALEQRPVFVPVMPAPSTPPAPAQPYWVGSPPTQWAYLAQPTYDGIGPNAKPVTTGS